MSEGYEKERTEQLSNLKRCRIGLVVLGALSIAIIWSYTFTVVGLRKELAEANRQLDFLTCRVQLPPEPMPDPVETPTLIEEVTPLTEAEFEKLQNDLKSKGTVVP